jgi:hypothetical protein
MNRSIVLSLLALIVSIVAFIFSVTTHILVTQGVNYQLNTNDYDSIVDDVASHIYFRMDEDITENFRNYAQGDYVSLPDDYFDKMLNNVVETYLNQKEYDIVHNDYQAFRDDVYSSIENHFDRGFISSYETKAEWLWRLNYARQSG